MRNPNSSHTLNFGDQIECFEICGNDFAAKLICVATEKKLTLGLISFPEENETDSFQWERIKDIFHETRSHAIAFSPDTSLMTIPKVVNLAVAGSDYLIRIFRTDLQNSDTVQKLKGHTSYVNDIAWNTFGDYMASVSDDHSCKIWCAKSNFESDTTFALLSPGMSCKWHPEEQHKLMVAEKRGVICIYNVRSQQAIVSVESPKYPLMYADWSLHNRFLLIAVNLGDIVTWDLRRPCKPVDVKQVHEDCARIVRYCPHSDLIASVGRPEITLKVFGAKSSVAIMETGLKVYGGIAWHHRLPYLGVAHDRKLSFWKIKTK